MKLRYYCILLALALVGFGAFGLSKRGTYTDITADPDYLYSLNVAELYTEAVENSCTSLMEELPSSPIILKVTPLAVPECFFRGRQQKVRVETVFAGDDLSAGDEVYITSDRWGYNLYEDAVETYFVNEMKVGKTYLIFLSGVVGTTGTEHTEVYSLQTVDASAILPVFCYDTCNNVIIPLPEEGSSYVPYSAVADNEFFAEEQEGLDAFLALKEELLAIYN